MTFSSNNIYFCKCQKADEKKSKEDEQTLEELNSAHRRSQAKCQLVQTMVQTSYLKRIKLFLFCHIVNILLTELSRSVWENLDLGRVYGPRCVRSVLMTSVKILPYRPPARLIRTKYKLYYLISGCVREVKKKGKFPIFSSKSCRLREVVAYKRFQIP